MTDRTVDDVLAELAALENPKMRAVNARHGDDHGVNLSKLRALAKDLKGRQDLAAELWQTGDTAARLLALLIVRPKDFTGAELHAMMREANGPKVHAWLMNYVVKKNSAAEELRITWLAAQDPALAAAGWELTSQKVTKSSGDLDLHRLVDEIEADMQDAPDPLQWAMNETLAQIGIHHPDLRARALAIGERLGVLKDYPTPPNCTSPYAPIWINEMVRRKDGA